MAERVRKEKAKKIQFQKLRSEERLMDIPAMAGRFLKTCQWRRNSTHYLKKKGTVKDVGYPWKSCRIQKILMKYV